MVHCLAQLGYITSAKGKGCGIQLAQYPPKLRLGDLVKALESNMLLVEYFSKKTNTCRIVSACKLKHYLMDANASFVDSLNQHTLADTVAENRLLFK